jgi:hypothetical protein
MHCAKHLDALLYALHLSASIGEWSANANANPNRYPNIDSDAHNNADCDTTPGALHGAESHRRQDEPGAICLERRRVYPA